ncbi:hypothetical protein [Anaerosporobacter faecicola]|uniref:hypothetical protein n=1 Tax=Anaerosporobacter faecicola TaxID=2718714 RepID=UPI00143C0AD7|nr:hypothetical protein [Anaerosporobacter faecicola]
MEEKVHIMGRRKTQYLFRINSSPEEINQIFQNYLKANGFQYEEKQNANYYILKNYLTGHRGFEYYIYGNMVTVYAYLGKFEKPYSLDGFVSKIPKQAYKNSLETLFLELKKYENQQTLQNQYSQDQYVQGQYMQGQYAQGQYTQGQYVQGQYEQDQYTQGQYVQDQYTQGQYTQGQYTQGQYTQGQYTQGQYEQDQYTQGQYTQGQYTQDQYAQDQYIKRQYTQNHYQQDFSLDNSLKTFVENNTKSKEKLATIGFIFSIFGLLLSFTGVSYGVIILIIEVYCGVQGLKTSNRNIAIATIVLVIISLLIFVWKIIKYVNFAIL